MQIRQVHVESRQEVLHRHVLVADLGGNHRLHHPGQGGVPRGDRVVVLEVGAFLLLGELVALQEQRQHHVGLLEHLEPVDHQGMEVQQQREFVGRGVLQVPQLAGQELLVLRMDPEGFVEGDDHALGTGPPLLHLLRGHVQGLHQPVPAERIGLLEFLHQVGGELQVGARHHVGEHVVVHHGRVLVGPGDAVDVESLRPVGFGPPETQVSPHPRGLHQHRGSVAVQEVHVPGDLAVLGKGMRDVGVDVVLRGSRSVVGGGLLTVDGAPREQRTLLAEHLGPFPGLRQQADPVAQGVAGDPGGRVGQEGNQIDLGVPEVVSLVSGTGHPLGGDAELVGTGRRLGQLEQAPANCLLDGRLTAHLDIRIGPEVIEPGALPLEERVETPLAHPVEGAAAAVEQFRDGNPARGVVGHRLADDDRHPFARLDAVDLLGLVLLDPGDHLVGVRGV